MEMYKLLLQLKKLGYLIWKREQRTYKVITYSNVGLLPFYKKLQAL